MNNKADYSTTIIYKIACNDPNITDKYVGHTTDIVRRRQQHKNNTCNKNSAYYNMKLYKFIREHGGWDNWKMEIIAHYSCNNLNEAKQKEQAHYTELKASLNSIEPLKHIETAKEYMKPLCDDKMTARFYCNYCDVTCSKPNDWQRHISTNKHIRAQKNLPTNPQKFICADCDYEFCRSYILERHKLSTRHKLRIKSNMLAETLNAPSADTVEPNIQPSQNEYANKPVVTLGNPPLDYMSIISQLLNQNNELKNFIIEQATEHKKETAEIVNKVIEQANEHKKDTLEIVNKVIERQLNR